MKPFPFAKAVHAIGWGENPAQLSRPKNQADQFGAVCHLPCFFKTDHQQQWAAAAGKLGIDLNLISHQMGRRTKTAICCQIKFYFIGFA